MLYGVKGLGEVKQHASTVYSVFQALNNSIDYLSYGMLTAMRLSEPILVIVKLSSVLQKTIDPLIDYLF